MSETRRYRLEQASHANKEEYYSYLNDADFFTQLTPENIEIFNNAYQKKEIASWALITDLKSSHGSIKKILDTI